MVAKFRKKPVVIEAVQLRWDNWDEMCDFANVGHPSEGDAPYGVYVQPDGTGSDSPTDEIGLHIPTLEGLMLGRQNDWIIRGVQGELYPCKPDIFEATYELIDPPHVVAEEDVFTECVNYPHSNLPWRYCDQRGCGWHE